MNCPSTLGLQDSATLSVASLVTLLTCQVITLSRATSTTPLSKLFCGARPSVIICLIRSPARFSDGFAKLPNWQTFPHSV